MAEYTPNFEAKTTFPNESYKLFDNRRYYKEQTTEIYNGINNNYIDLWYDVPYYGKVNRKGVLVAPKEGPLGYSANENLVTFDFVKQAYEEMVFFLKRGALAGRTELGALLNDYRPARSFIDSKGRYMAYASQVIDIFNSQLLVKNKKALNFGDYVCEVLKLLFSSKTVFTYYSIFAGHYTPIGASGLAIEFSTENHDNDNLKNSFFKNEEFGKYVNTAANFGFRINKNAPWQLIADLNSKPMLHGRQINRNGQITKIPGYMSQNYIPSIDFLFERHYTHVMTDSVRLLRQVLFSGYSKYHRKVAYVTFYGKPKIQIEWQTFKLITFADIWRPPAKIFPIKNYNKKPGMTYMLDSKDIMPHYGEDYFVKILETLLKREYSVKDDQKYRSFKKRFDKSNKIHFLFDATELLESFYSPTKIHDPETKKPLWTMKKNKLTSKKAQNIILDEKKKPTIAKVVSEFHTGF